MTHTLEVRWFKDGPLPSSVVEWIQSKEAQTESARTDLYLLSTDPAMNIKLREGRIETKRRTGERTKITFSNDVQGVQEWWTKWSFPTVEHHQELFEEDPSALWVPVHKERIRITFTPKMQSRMLPRLIESSPAKAKLELTKLRAQKQEAWTICLEAEGRRNVLSGTLQQTGKHIFSRTFPLQLTTNDSFGYSRWLQVLKSEMDPTRLDY